MHLIPVYLLLAAALVVSGLTAVASDDPEARLEQDDDTGALSVNEGTLDFLQDPQDRRVLQTRNWFTITPESLRTGWVELHQCQGNLDPVPAVEIVYRYHVLRNLRVISARGIASARVEQNTVQMEQVQEGGKVCIEAEVQVLKPDGETAYTLQSGPFHRRFLDGYYPVRLDYRIHWPADRLQLESVHPEIQPGFSLREQPGELAIDTLFEGRLTIDVRFNTP
ncbi:MAG: hypothetical protein ABFS24_13990 [Pseudomonadota bacterium]